MQADNQLTPEEWRAVPGFPGYEVSNLGRVRSLDRVSIARNGAPRRIRGSLMAGSPGGPMGYLYVNLRSPGVRKVIPIHRLVAEAFIGPRLEGMSTRHLTGDHLDNRVVNLAYGTHADNMQDSLRHGTNSRQKRTHCPAGHLYDQANTRIYRGSRYCRACERERSVRRRNAA